jgi:hypothetical protein
MAPGAVCADHFSTIGVGVTPPPLELFAKLLSP